MNIVALKELKEISIPYSSLVDTQGFHLNDLLYILSSNVNLLIQLIFICLIV